MPTLSKLQMDSMDNTDTGAGKLETIQQFDSGLESITQGDLAPKSISNEDLDRKLVSNVLITCLLEQLCSFLESDPRKATLLCTVIIQQLIAGKLADQSISSKATRDFSNANKIRLAELVHFAQKKVHEELEKSVQVFSEKTTNGTNSSTTTIESRLLKEFDNFDFLGAGGFAKVYAATNKLDGQTYAIKKSVFKTFNATSLKMLQEVKVLAKLNCPNVIKYYTAWIEPSSKKVDTVLGQSEQMHYKRANEETETETQDTNTNTVDEHTKTSSGEADEEEEHTKTGNGNASQDSETDSEKSESSVNSVKLAPNGSSNVGDESSSESIEFLEMSEDKLDKVTAKSSINTTDSKAVAPLVVAKLDPKEARSFLFIQMELCERTLRNWIDTRHEDIYDGSTVSYLVKKDSLNFYSQLVSALEYLHHQRIVHHDIKPSNIFISGEGIKLADFGLACQYESSKFLNHSDFGTHSYAAPEQLHGGLCNFKSDVYSSGIVLAELLMPKFKTAHERGEIIEAIRHENRAPDRIKEHYPQWGQLIELTTHLNPKKRPTASRLKCKVVNLIDDWCKYAEKPRPVNEKKFSSSNGESRSPNRPPLKYYGSGNGGVPMAKNPQEPYSRLTANCEVCFVWSPSFMEKQRDENEIKRLRNEIESLKRRNSELEELVQEKDPDTLPSN